LDLASVEPSVSGPKRPQDRINLPELKQTFEALFEKPLQEGGYGKRTSDLSLRVPVHINGSTPAADIQMPSTDTNANHPEEGLSKNEAELIQNRPTPGNPVFRASPSRPPDTEIGHGSVLIAAITSRTNTSNPNVMLGAGLLAKKAVERGLKVNPTVKTSMAPGSRVVTDYLAKTGLQSYLESNDFVAAAVLSGNRNFEARIHQNIKANFLMSPPLVVAFALAGRVDLDLVKEPIGKDKSGKDVYLKDLWPSLEEIREAMASALSPEVFRQLYSDFASQNPKWNEIPSSSGELYSWDEKSDYIQEPPFFENFSMEVAGTEEI